MRAIQEKLAGVRGAPIPETNDETAEGADAISQSATVPRFGRFILFPARGVSSVPGRLCAFHHRGITTVSPPRSYATVLAIPTNRVTIETRTTSR